MPFLFCKVTFNFDLAMLRPVIAGFLLLLHLISFVFVMKPDEQERYVATGKLIDQSGTSEADYYLYSSYISLKLPATVAKRGDGSRYKEDMYSHSRLNIISPPPERTTL